ncbi:MAG: hypothetical protein V2I33_16870 [Kangiellaceae bacterium]|jgi:RNA polymerase-interacting CarD/CdnL/TRCF family regulator|nr:hypothetical protein [Kangiellaceae bacterium]
MGGKLDRADFERLTLPEIRAKAEKADLDHILSTMTNDKRTTEFKLNEQMKEVENYMNLLKGEIEKLSSDIYHEIQRKAEMKDLDKIADVLYTKADMDAVN